MTEHDHDHRRDATFLSLVWALFAILMAAMVVMGYALAQQAETLKEAANVVCESRRANLILINTQNRSLYEIEAKNTAVTDAVRESRLKIYGTILDVPECPAVQ